jgi:hypothetical protein
MTYVKLIKLDPKFSKLSYDWADPDAYMVNEGFKLQYIERKPGDK